MQEVFAALRVAITATFLLYSSWRDYKSREVSDRVWVAFAPLALVLILPELLLYDPQSLMLFGISAAVTGGIAMLLFYVGAFGGADSKAFMCIAVALPFFPQTILTPIIPEGLSPLSTVVFPLTILSNSVLIAAASALYLLLSNIAKHAAKRRQVFEGTLSKEPIFRKLMVLITGRKVPISILEEKWHVYPLEDISKEGNLERRRLLVMPDDENRDDIVERLSKAAKAGKIQGQIWSTPGLPMLIFVTAGLLLSLVFGDIIWMLITCIMG